MKRTHFGKNFKKTFLAVPAAALMLGVSQGQTTIGLNFQTYYYSSGTTPQTIGYGAGYQTTGFPVTGTAFGVAPSNWWNTDPLSGGHNGVGVPLTQNATFNLSTNFDSTLSVYVTAPDAWQSGIGEEVAGWHPETVAPGNNEVTWSYLDSSSSQSPTASVLGLAGKFPHGYVVQTIAAENGVVGFDDIQITDGSTTNTLAYSTYYVASPETDGYDVGGTVGVSQQSGVFTGDNLTIICGAQTTGDRSTLAGFIMTDQPVVTQPPGDTTNVLGSTLVLNAGAIGIPPLSYQWQFNGTNITGATNSAYTNSSVQQVDAGGYDVIVTNLYGSTISTTSTLAVVSAPVITTDLAGGTNIAYVGLPTLSIVASGPSLSYQWDMNGAAIAGATNSSVTLSNVSTGTFGFSVVVTNAYGVANSSTNYYDFVAAPDAYTTSVGNDGPVSYWPLNETTGTSALDYSGNGHTGALNGTITLGAAGPQPPAFSGFSGGKTAYLLDGSSGYIAGGTNASLSGTNDFTVEAWIQTTSAGGGEIVDQRDTNGFTGEYRCEMDASGSLEFSIYGSGGYQFDITSSKTVNDGKWHQVAFVRGGMTGTIYIDGAVVASGSGVVQPLSSTLQTYIGANIRDGNNYFGGSMADVAIYNHPLGANGVIDHYIAATGIPMTVALVDGGVIQDSKPAGTLHDGLNFGTTWLASSTDFNSVTRDGVQQFDETNNTQITIAPSTDFESTNGTICFWMNYAFPLSGLPGPGAEAAMLFDCRNTNGTIIGLNTGGYVEFQNLYPSNGLNFNNKIIGGVAIGDGNWHHVAVTYDQSSNGVVSIYVDGVLDTAANNPGAWTWPTNEEIELGRSHDPYWFIYNGQMDDFRIYNRILTPTEISTIGTETNSDTLIDTNALKVRFDFNGDSALYGKSIVWPYGTLVSSPVLGHGATWTPVTNPYSIEAISSPLPIVPSAPAMYYRTMRTP